MKNWTTLVMLAVAQFVMVLDSTVMNVSISQVVADLNTTVTHLQPLGKAEEPEPDAAPDPLPPLVPS